MEHPFLFFQYILKIHFIHTHYRHIFKVLLSVIFLMIFWYNSPGKLFLQFLSWNIVYLIGIYFLPSFKHDFHFDSQKYYFRFIFYSN